MKPFKYLLAAVIIIFIVTTISKCNNYKKLSNQYKNDYGLLKQDYETFKTRQEDIITKQKVIITDSKKDIQKLLTDIEYLRKKKRTIETVISYETVTLIDSFYITYTDTVTTDTIRHFRAINEFYTISGKTMQRGILFDSIYFPNKITTVIEQKGGIFYKNQTLYLNNSNKYTNNKNVQSVTLNKKPTRLSKGLSTAAKIGIGILIGKIL